MKSLTTLLSSIMVEEIIGSDDKVITDVVSDSRKVTTGSLFVAVRGTNVDGHSFIPLLQYSGVAAIVCEEFPEFLETSITYIKVSDSAVALGYLASEWWDNPSRKLKLVGVTGTNGKTTTATLIYEMARLMGYKAGLLSTVCNYIETETIPTTQTTPDPLTINALLHRMVEAGCSYASMEVSSHAAHQHRIAGLHFAGGIFSNLTRDHLDYHKTVEAYLAAKKSFFDGLPASAFALTNIDDKVGEVMLQNTDAKKYTYSLRTRADFNGRIIESRLDGTTMTFNGREVEVLFTGKFNAYNLTAVYGSLGASRLGCRRNSCVHEPSRACSRTIPGVPFAEGLYRHRRLCSYPRCRSQRTAGNTRGSRQPGLNHHRCRRRRQPRQGKTPHHGKRSIVTQRPPHTHIRQSTR